MTAVHTAPPPSDEGADPAEQAARTGDLDAALRTADAALRDRSDPDGQLRAAAVLAAVLPHRGLLSRSADLHRWLARRQGASAPDAAVALLGVGALDEATAAVVSADDDAPGLADAADVLTARGALATVTGDSSAALSLLSRAAAALAVCDRPAVRGDTPAALGALVALHRGEPELAGPLLDRALALDLGGPAHRRRHLLLRAWCALAAGDAAGARTWRARAGEAGPETVEPRDELVAVALDVALARRAGDVRALLDLWARAREALVRHPVDLYVLLPVGELALAAARLGEQGWVAPHLDDGSALLAALGEPALWSTPWHWYGLQYAIATEQSALAAVHAQALADAAQVAHPAVAPARAAAAWLRVLDGDVDPDEVTAAATGLRAAGLGWDGSRLAGEAALRTTDRRAISSLLACARDLHPDTSDTPDVPAPRTSGVVLSDREREVAALVVEGLTYREIGARLFLSAKTVEHHVARLRQRLGSATRSELFGDLRAALGR
ncbi:regulatory LuxR family protein [Actinomycetospora succinea]|uniref:Regulatory LuxR family protein n=1 Tax=Actinomycetospora succinea TaxID=663603 RepID=A0A4R6V500_9PSEU|nr:helix-turn-helix transcriptional regulator [Actinomycetospora succinea]TDQ53991.1 regulatory LuxR family protein [Actinomycetospora succinea]